MKITDTIALASALASLAVLAAQMQPPSITNGPPIIDDPPRQLCICVSDFKCCVDFGVFSNNSIAPMCKVTGCCRGDGCLNVGDPPEYLSFIPPGTGAPSFSLSLSILPPSGTAPVELEPSLVPRTAVGLEASEEFWSAAPRATETLGSANSSVGVDLWAPRTLITRVVKIIVPTQASNSLETESA